MDLGDYLNSINKTKVNLMRESEDPKAVSGFPAFAVRRSLSYFGDTVLIANEINKWPDLDSQMQYEFLLLAVEKRNRFARWEKRPVIADLELIKSCYGYSDAKAASVLEFLSPADLEDIRRYMREGGVAESTVGKAKPKPKSKTKK